MKVRLNVGMVMLIHTAGGIEIASVSLGRAINFDQASIEVVNTVVSIHGCILPIDIINGRHCPYNLAIFLFYAVFLFINSLELLGFLNQSLRWLPLVQFLIALRNSLRVY